MTAFRRAPALFLTLAGTALAAPALAGTGLSIPLAPAAETNIIMTQYSCDGGAPFDVQYINAGENNLALIPIDGIERVFVLTVSASGARYVSGQHEWWSKGDAATLDDTLTEAPAQDCREAGPAM
ncbi:MliC family protein [Paracoccus sp. (in: a-proteobacteria)]|uniref:MliC family protein n=1 Tax=Paracoccus sp. TaxID=267 RepID=UPI0035B08589